MFRSFLRMQLLSPNRIGGFVTHLPSFVRVFYRLMHDSRVSLLAKLVPILGVLLLFTPPALELDFIPLVGELDWLLVAYFTLKVFLWLCPPEVVREHIARVARGA
ncbi:MAG TPA: hypothetical protein VJN94_02375 [Candidatus Binataceae bacterium]|nr:hypothetical protein [Candidatus Binataceae bacterium]